MPTEHDWTISHARMECIAELVMHHTPRTVAEILIREGDAEGDEVLHELVAYAIHSLQWRLRRKANDLRDALDELKELKD